MNIEPVGDKWRAFGWHTLSIDGHDMQAIVDALDEAEKVKGKPCMILAKTVKGKGVSFFEGKAEYHGVTPTKEELELAIKELS
jgi:transketolase